MTRTPLSLNRAGMTIVEVLMASLLVSVLFLATAGIYSSSARLIKKMAVRESKDSSWQVLAKTAMVSLTTIRFQSFSFSDSFAAEVDSVGNPLKYHRITGGATPESSIITLNGTSVFNDSFTVEKRVNLNGAGLAQRIGGILASRCVPLTVNGIASSGTTLLRSDPKENAEYVLRSLTHRPFQFVRWDETAAQFKSYVLCCDSQLNTVSPEEGCAAEGTMVPRIYNISLDSVSGGINDVQEDPVPLETGTVLGVGFFLSFNRSQAPSYYKARLFQIYSACAYSGVAGQNCPELRPDRLVYSEAFGGLDAEKLRDLRTVFHEYSGTVVSNIANTGIIRLGN